MFKKSTGIAGRSFWGFTNAANVLNLTVILEYAVRGGHGQFIISWRCVKNATHTTSPNWYVEMGRNHNPSHPKIRDFCHVGEMFCQSFGENKFPKSAPKTKI